MKRKQKMENKNKLNKAFRFNAAVYLVMKAGNFEGNFTIVQGRVVGARQWQTAYSNMLYTIVVHGMAYECLPSDLYESVDELIADFKNRVDE